MLNEKVAISSLRGYNVYSVPFENANIDCGSTINNSDALIYFFKSNTLSTLKRTGYQFVREYDFLLYCYFLKFKKGN